ncbi:uncharacterized protein LOC123305502 [Chrysoperla carnea]|uniref:uncharacterized protein LOC123305502 n=1 Tax=Chrysoperla carnea TaxID=189513 RepID=UPI001D093D5A|nr:uncharacterized protein LOC123305502 [Chrysoperla carnea]
MEVQIFLVCLYLFLSIVFINCDHELDPKPPDIGYSLNASCTKVCFSFELLCKDSICVCKDGFYADYGAEECFKCPGLLQKCDVSNCCQKGLVCYNNTCQQDVSMIEYTSSVAFGIAIVLGVIALGSVIWKVFISTYRFESDRNAVGRASQRSNASMNSIQRLVIERLQNRPPSYAETMRQQIILSRGGLDNVEAPPPYTLFCRDETNVVPNEFVEIMDNKENCPNDFVTEDTVVHI